MNLPYVSVVPSTFTIPETLYKYREVNKNSLASLLCNQVYFARVKDFNDPYEPAKIFEESRFGEVLERELNESGVLCLCREAENLAMWSYYAAALKGFAIGYKTEALLTTLEKDGWSHEFLTAREEWKYVYELDYSATEIAPVLTERIIDSSDKVRHPEETKIFATKSSIFSHEKEVRIVIRPGSIKQSTRDFEYSSYGLYNHQPHAISEIVFGEFISEQDERAIRSALGDRNIIFKKAIRSKNEFKIELVTLA